LYVINNKQSNLILPLPPSPSPSPLSHYLILVYKTTICSDLQTGTANLKLSVLYHFCQVKKRFISKLSNYSSACVCRFYWFIFWNWNERVESKRYLYGAEKKDVLTAVHNNNFCSISFINAMMPIITDRLVICLKWYDHFYTSGAYFHYLSLCPTTLRAGTASSSVYLT